MSTNLMKEKGANEAPKGPSMSQRLKDLGVSDSKSSEVAYIEKVLHPLMVAMTKHVVKSKPTDPAGILIKFLLDYKGAPDKVRNQVNRWLDIEGDQTEGTENQDDLISDLQNQKISSKRVTNIHEEHEEDLEHEEGESGVQSLSVARRGINSISQNRRNTDLENQSKGLEKTDSKKMKAGAISEHDEHDEEHDSSTNLSHTTFRTPGGSCLKVSNPSGGVKALDSMNMGFFHKKRLEISETEKLDLVKSCKQLKGLKKSDQEHIARAFEIVHFPEHEAIMRHNDPCKGIHLIVSGSARMAIPQDIATLERGEMVGENAFLQDTPCEYNLTSSGPGGVVALHIPFLVCKVLGLKKKLAINTKRKHKIKNAIHGKGHKHDKHHHHGEDPTSSKSWQTQKKMRMSLKDPGAAAGEASVGVGMEIDLEDKHATSEEDRTLIHRAVKQNDNLTDMLQLEDSQLEKFVDAVIKQFIPAGQSLVEQGEIDDAFYIVHDGMFSVQGDHDTKLSLNFPYKNGQLRAGDTFGELALLYDAPAEYGIKAIRDSVVWVLTRDSFQHVMRLKSEKRITDYVDLVNTIPFLSSRLNDEEKEVLADALEEQFFVRNETIVTEGEAGHTFYIVFEGECQILQDGEIIDKVSRGAWFGEKALLEDVPRQATITAASNYVIVLTLDRMSFDLLLSPLEDLLIKHAGGAGILQTRNSLLIMQHSMVKRQSQAPGNRQSVAIGMDKTASTNLTRQSVGLGLGAISDATMNAPTEREDLNMIGVLGTGSFGYVSLEEYAGNLYALKALAKAHIVHEGIQSQCQNERACMSMVDSPFVVKLYRTYQDTKTIYFLLEPAFGGELFDLYNDKELFGSQEHARFYGACITLGLDHLHSRRIVYRDLKFENCLIATNGYTKLTDMGIAKVVVGKTYTVCGTSDYFAPETLRQIGHNRAVDWWALGVMLFIGMAGRPPFDAPTVMQIYKNITKGFAKVAIPKEFDEHTTGVITSLCQKKPEERITMGKSGVKNLQEHPWFEKIDWKRLTKQVDPAPYIPDIPEDPKTIVKKDVDDCAFTEYENQEYEDDGSGWDADF